MSRTIGVEFGWFPHWVLRDPVWTTLTPSARLVYFRICDQAEHVGGKVWVARSATRYIAKLEGMHHDTVGIAIGELIKAGLIVREDEPKRGRIPKYRMVTGRVRFREMSDSPAISAAEMSDPPAISPADEMSESTAISSAGDVGIHGHIEEPSTANPANYAENPGAWHLANPHEEMGINEEEISVCGGSGASAPEKVTTHTPEDGNTPDTHGGACRRPPHPRSASYRRPH